MSEEKKVEYLGVPIKSPSDKKDYRVMKLKNGLKVLLIKNPKDDENAAAQIKVNVGTFDNPDHVEGLAHFLEHLMNMGSEKYPTESFYTDFMHANGGSDNANTTSDTTNYYFTISEKAFVEGLDIFASMFVSPLLSKNSMQREREAVDSEYRQALTNDFVVLERIFQNFANDKHPYRKFDCGNLKTLKENISDDDLHRETLKLYEKYNASRMYLTIESHRSLDELENLVVEKFSGIKSGEDTRAVYPTYDQAFDEEYFTKVIYFKPKVDLKMVMLTWVLPPYHVNYKKNLTGFFGEMIKASEHEGGLVKYLRDRGLINVLQHVEPYINDSFYQFKIAFIAVNSFTNEDIEKILKAFYSYLMMLKETPIEEHRKKFEERSKRKKIEFRFREEQSALSNVKNLSENLKLCEVSDILARHSLIEFDDNIFNEFMGILTSGKFNITIMDPAHEDFNRREDKYDRVYHSLDHPESWKKLWEERKSSPEFHLENLNPFIAENFEIVANAEESPEYPEKIADTGAFELWHKLDAKFNSPKAYVKVRFLAPISFRNTESFVLQEIYDYMLTYYIKDIVEKGQHAHLGFGSSSATRIFELTFEGFNDKLSKFFEVIINKIKEYNDNFDDKYFESVVNEIKLKYKRSMAGVKQLNTDTVDEVLSDSYEHDIEIYEKVKQITFNDLKMFVPKFFRKMKVMILVQGNVRRSEAKNLLKIVQENFPIEAIEEKLSLKGQCYEVPLGERFLRVKSMQRRDDNSMIKSYYQIGKATVRTKAYMSFLKLILYPKAFDYLRNKEQLGYSVGMDSRQIEGVLGLLVYVGSQEMKHPFPEVQGKIKHFVNVVAKKAIEELTDKEFETLKETLIQKVKEKDDALSKEFSRNWNEIKSMEHRFNIKDITGKVYESIQKTEIQEYFKSFTDPEKVRILNVHAIGDVNADFDEPKFELIQEKSSEDEIIITDIEKFKSTMSLYPVIKFEI